MRVASQSAKLWISLFSVVQTVAIAAEIPGLSGWTIDTVDAVGRGTYTSLKVDKSGNIHVAYVPENPEHPLKYAFWDQSIKRWFTTKVAGGSSFCTLVLDSKQYPRISWATFGTGQGARLNYSHWDGASWTTQSVSPHNDGVVAYYTSIALDAQDKPSFSFYEYLGPGFVQLIRLRSVFWAGSQWEVRMADPAQGSGKFNAIAVDSKGYPHIAYANVKAETAGLRYASWDGHSWKTEVLEGPTVGGAAVYDQAVNLVLDKNDDPHLVFSDAGKALLKYATRHRGGPWQIQALDTIGVALPDRNGIALDSEGHPYLSYYDTRTAQLRIAFQRNGAWQREIVDKDGSGFTSSIGLDDQTVWVAYGSEADGTLMVAHRSLGPIIPSQTQAGIPVVNRK